MGAAERLAAKRDSSVVCLVHDSGTADPGPASIRAVLSTVRAHTPSEVPVVVLSAEVDRLDAPGGDPEPEVLGIGLPGATTAQLVRRAAEAFADADLVLLDGSCRVPDGWLSRLRNAARGDASVATATPLGSDGATVGVPGPGGGEADRLVAAASPRARPRLLIGGPHCLYLRRSALEVIGGVGGEPTSLAALIAALCRRCVAAGLLNVLADDVYIECAPDPGGDGGSLGGALGELDRADDRSALQRSLQLVGATLNGLSVTIDARSLGPTPGGTQRYTLELVLALARYPRAALRVVVAPHIGAETEAVLRGAEGVEVITYEQAAAGVALTDIVHRPQQAFSEADLALLRRLGRRVIITHQDLIAYHNPTYHADIETFQQYRRISRIALAVADRVVFFSEHSLRDARAEDLIDAQRADVVGVALETSSPGRASRPRGAPVDEPFLLCLGPDYRHKNRRFAIALAGALRAEQGWRGKLVLAGARVPFGSSRADEERLLAADPALAEAVLDLGSVDDGERAWLFERAGAVLVPSVAEGFGLLPLEAAQAALPCLFAPVASLVEVVDPALATLVAWDPSQSAERVIALLGDTPERAEHVERLAASARRWTWERLTGQLIELLSEGAAHAIPGRGRPRLAGARA